MKRLALVVLVLTSMSGLAAADGKIAATLYKQPSCTCCDAYADYLRENGFDVTVHARAEIRDAPPRSSVRKELQGCHSTSIDKYVIEGHVPVGPIKRLLAEKPDIKGLSLPNMPQGSPGMPGAKQAPFEILSITDGAGPAPVYMKE